jgi:RNA polymerase-binding transcription factor DksA
VRTRARRKLRIKEDLMIHAHRENADLAAIRQNLLARRQELDTRQRRLSADRRRENEPLAIDAPDRAIQLQNDEVVDSIESAVSEELRSIAAALQRMESGRYGVCETCGADIEPNRLAAVPYAVECQSCAAQANS